jgi:mono/diheme cytochrome c family protein
MRVLNMATALALALSCGSARAAQLGDPQRGLAYAKKNCAKCHAVEAGDMFSPTMIAPTFSAVAETPGMNERALLVWFQSSDHATMPNLILAQKDLDDVVAYILSLRAKK